MNYPKFSLLVLPYTRLELLGWGKLLKTVGVFRNELWEQAPIRRIKGKLHGYSMTLDLSNWSERYTYFLGRFYDLPTQLFIKAIVQPGDCCIDVGANIGTISLLAARCVGKTGVVHAFEPNPKAFERLQEAVNENQLQQVILHPCGLCDRPDELTLNVATQHTGTGTFAKLSTKVRISNQYQVRVERGDDILPDNLPEVRLIKIDVEGFEPYVLKGLSQTISRFQPLIITEAVEDHLKRAGSSWEQLYTLMQDYGYEAFSLESKRVIFRHHLQLRKVTDRKTTNDIVWVHPNSNVSSQLEPWIVS